jgi:prolyl oligopeptidase
VWFNSKDGTKVPMFLVRKKNVLPTLDSKPKKPIPTLIYTYGGYGLSTNPHFSNSILVWMNNMDGMYVLASIRGGGELGSEWHE